MKKEVIKRMKELLGKFKLRFSYFLFIGIIGFILQFISYFLVASPVSFATLYAQKMSATFKSYVAPSYLNLSASFLIGGCAIGFIKASKKEQTYVKISSFALLGSEILLSIISLVSIICLYALRVKLKTPSVNNLVYVLSSCKLISYLISSLFNDALNTYFSYYVTLNVDISYKTINGFIFGQLNGMKETIDVAGSYGNNSLVVTCVFGVIYQIIYLLMVGGSLVFLFTAFIKSYDVDKDENRMSL